MVTEVVVVAVVVVAVVVVVVVVVVAVVSVPSHLVDLLTHMSAIVSGLPSSQRNPAHTTASRQELGPASPV